MLMCCDDYSFSLNWRKRSLNFTKCISQTKKKVVSCFPFEKHIMLRRFRPTAEFHHYLSSPLVLVAPFQSLRCDATFNASTNLDTFLQTNICTDFLLTETKVRITNRCDRDLLALLPADRDPSTWTLSRLQEEMRSNASKPSKVTKQHQSRVPNQSLLHKIRYSSENAIMFDCAKFLEKSGATTVETYIEGFHQRNASDFDAVLQTVLFPKLQKRFFDLITKETSVGLICGIAYRNHGCGRIMCSRQSELNRLRKVVREKFLTKEGTTLPFVLVSSPRGGGGKTLFLDSVANDRELFQSNDPTFSFNITCSSCDQSGKNPSSRRRKQSLQNRREEEGLCEILGRLAGSALGISRDFQDDEDKLMKIVRYLFCAGNMTFGQFVRMLQERIAQVHCQESPETCNWIFCFDDLSNLLDSFSYSSPPSLKIPHLDAKIDKQCNLIKRKIIKAVSGLIRRNTLCIASGSGFRTPLLLDNLFHHRKSKKSFATPEFFYLPLVDPISDSPRRRDSHVLKTIYFSRMHLCVRPQDFPLAIYFYEMTKSSPQSMRKMIEGFHCVRKYSPEEADDAKKAAKKSFDEIVRDVNAPQIKNGLISMLTILRLKSFQFWKGVPARLGSDCNEDIIDVGFRTNSFSSSHRFQDHLENVFVEPLFFASEIMSTQIPIASHSTKHLFVRYTKMLQQYSLHFLHFRSYEAAISAMRHFVPDEEDSDRTSQVFSPVSIESRPRLTSMFFDSAVAIGICIQKSLRRSLLQKNNDSRDQSCCSNDATCSVDDFLLQKRIDEDDGLVSSERVFSSYPLSSSAPQMLWSCASNHSSNCSSPKIMNFRGHYPLAGKAHVYDPFHCNHNEEDRFDCPRSDSIGNYFNTATVLCAELCDKHYGNPLVDIIFHQKANHHHQEGSSSLIQFWIDTKLRHSRQESFLGNTFSAFVSRVAQALDNPLLRTQHSNCKVKHIVHIIVTPTLRPSTGSDTTANIRKQFFNTSDDILKKTTQNKISYSLYFVSPDSLGFENLVSHYVARTIPLQDQQMRESWSNRPKSAREWRTYKATSSLNLEHDITKAAQDQNIPLSAAFGEWSTLRIRDESASLAYSTLQLDIDEDADHDERSLTFLKQIQSIDFVKNLNQSVTFGDVLERLQIIQPQDNASWIFNDENIRDDVGQYVAAIGSIDKFRFHFLEAGLCVGIMLNQSAQDEMGRVWWNFLFEPSFIAAWNQEASILFDKGEIDHEWVSRCDKNGLNNNSFIQNKNMNKFDEAKDPSILFDMSKPFYGPATVAVIVWDMKLWRWGELRGISTPRPHLKRSRHDHDGLTVALQTSQCVYILESLAKRDEWQSVRDFMATVDERLYSFKKYSIVSGQ